MRRKLFVSSLSVLIVSCLLIAYSERATDMTAVIGYAGLVATLVLVMIGLFFRDKKALPLELGTEENLALRAEFRRNGEVSAIKMLRENHPNLSIKDAPHAINTLMK
ncbi:hypothetical protein [Corynebacterium macginleyi]|uniref:hypothetical protein n=1 Tax=Corynebacterium macginleyi TaxID=38290 RepID=UPI00190C65E9|nr:hypothetical protein [Corynebacterium macginleyi]MBK4148016.1 hypothetical protein [Corynebacterium macginleyi]